MTSYIDILLTKDGYFCAAEPWTINEGDLVCLPDALMGDKFKEVVAVATDSKDGDHIKQIEKFIGHPLPRITAKAKIYPIVLEDDNDVSER